MTFREQLVITIVDKAAIGALLLFAGWWLNRALERSKSANALRNEYAKLRDTKRIEFLDKQLSQFYYPIYIRLHIDGAVWDRILDREKGNDELRQRIGRAIEKSVILPNHEAIVRIIESNIHLAEADHAAFQAMLHYVRHVAVYRALRESGTEDVDPLGVGEPWPSHFLPLIEHTAALLQKRYDRLVEMTTTSEHELDGARSHRDAQSG